MQTCSSCFVRRTIAKSSLSHTSHDIQCSMQESPDGRSRDRGAGEAAAAEPPRTCSAECDAQPVHQNLPAAGPPAVWPGRLQPAAGPAGHAGRCGPCLSAARPPTPSSLPATSGPGFPRAALLFSATSCRSPPTRLLTFAISCALLYSSLSYHVKEIGKSVGRGRPPGGGGGVVYGGVYIKHVKRLHED